MTIVGIDPGNSGGIAVLDENGIRALHSMPVLTEKVGKKIVHRPDPGSIAVILDELRHALVFIENVPKWCGGAQFQKKNIPGSTMATLYGNFMLCVGICHGLHVEPILLSPQRWQRVVECQNVDRLDRGAWKRRLKERAAELFPTAKITLANADALLIAYAGMRLSALYGGLNPASTV